MKSMPLQRLDVVQLLEATLQMADPKLRIATDGAWISVNKGNDYRIKIANAEVIRRIDLVGFIPPPLKGFKYLAEPYGKIMAQIDTDFPPNYVKELIRATTYGMIKNLPIVAPGEWDRKTAPILHFNTGMDKVLGRMLIVERKALETMLERNAIANIFRPAVITKPVREYLATDKEFVYHNNAIEEDLLPPLNFDADDNSSGDERRLLDVHNIEIIEMVRVNPTAFPRTAALLKEFDHAEDTEKDLIAYINDCTITTAVGIKRVPKTDK